MLTASLAEELTHSFVEIYASSGARPRKKARRYGKSAASVQCSSRSNEEGLATFARALELCVDQPACGLAEVAARRYGAQLALDDLRKVGTRQGRYQDLPWHLQGAILRTHITSLAASLCSDRDLVAVCRLLLKRICLTEALIVLRAYIYHAPSRSESSYLDPMIQLWRKHNQLPLFLQTARHFGLCTSSTLIDGGVAVDAVRAFSREMAQVAQKERDRWGAILQRRMIVGQTDKRNIRPLPRRTRILASATPSPPNSEDEADMLADARS